MAAWRIIWRWLANIVRIGSLLWLVFHFALTVAYVMPVNPIKISLQPLIYATVGTYFQQNWSFFAPNPLAADYALLARPLDQVEVEAIPKKGLPTRGWYDLSAPLWAHFQKNRFSAYERLARPHGNALMIYLSGGLELVPWLEACLKGDSASCTFYEERLKVARSQAAELLAKVGSAFCKDLGESGQNYTHVALRVRERLSVPWSERHTGEGLVRDIELGVYPINKSMASAGLYLAGKPE